MENHQEDTEFPDEAEVLQPEPPRVHPMGNPQEFPATPPEGQQLATPIVQERQPLTEAAKNVPVGDRGAAPTTFEQQVTLAQFMAKANVSLPKFLRGNVGDCLAIIDIASRTGLSPYMLANTAYQTPAGGMAFESKAYHAILIQSGRIKESALHVRYEGEGPARKCIVWGTLIGETEPRTYTSPPLYKLHPGYSYKTREGNTNSAKDITYVEGQRLIAAARVQAKAAAIEAGMSEDEAGMIAEAATVPGLWVKGSPLWDDKPDVQHFYDTTRDWGRMFTPVATLGVLERYEPIEHPIRGTAEILPADNSLKDRLAKADRSEGYQNGHADRELANVAADKGEIEPAQTIQPAEGQEPPKAQDTKPEQPKQPDPPRATSLERARKPTAKQAAAAADRAEKKAADKAKPKESEQPKVPAKPTTAAEYQVYCIDWINRGGDPEAALQRWESERGMRKDCGVRVNLASDLRNRIEKKHGV